MNLSEETLRTLASHVSGSTRPVSTSPASHPVGRGARMWTFATTSLSLALAGCGGGAGVDVGSSSSAVTGSSGTGPDFCASVGGSNLGSEYANVYTCGPVRTFQCVEYIARYFHNIFDLSSAGIDYGRNAASILHGRYPQYGLGSPGAGRLPAPGDIISLWGPSTSDAYGHTGVVAAVAVSAEGTGKVTFYAQNGTVNGVDSITVTRWTLSYGKPGTKYYYDQFNWLELRAAAPPPPPPEVALVGDFNGDGKADVLVRGGPGWDTTPVFFSEGNGTFKFSNALDPAKTIFNYTGATSYVGDFNGDGKADVVLKNGPGWDTTPVYFSKGDGTFGFSNAHDPSGDIFNYAGAQNLIGDFNGDGKMDIVMKSINWDTTPVFLSNGDGTFQFKNAPDPAKTIFNDTGAQSFVGDFDGDGKADVVLKYGAGWDTTPVYLSNGDGTFRVSSAPDPSKGIFNYAGAQSFVGDFNGDGKTDILMKAPGWDTTPVFFSNGDGSFRYTNAHDPSGDIFDYTEAETFVGDFNGDGRDDILMRFAGWDTTPIFVSNGDGTFQFVNAPDPSRAIFNFTVASSLLGDFNGDGELDVVVRGGPGWDTTPVFLSTGSAFTFSNASDPSGGIFNVR
jgi:FG-GAP-like repeat/CHAP domain